MKTKVITICLALLIVTLLGACGKQVSITDDMTPSQTAEAFLEAFKSQDWDSLDQIYAGKGSDFEAAYGTTEDSDDATNAQRNAFLSKMYEFDYKVEGETIAEDENTATVDIKTTTYNMVDVFNNFYQEYMEQALDKYTGNSSDMDQKELEEMAITILQEQLDSAKKDYKGAASLPMTKTDGKWIVDEIDENNTGFLNAISGGMMDVASDIVNAKTGSGAEKKTKDSTSDDK